MKLLTEQWKEVVEWITLNVASAIYVFVHALWQDVEKSNVEQLVGILVGVTIIVFNIARVYKIIVDERARRSDREWLNKEINLLHKKRQKKNESKP